MKCPPKPPQMTSLMVHGSFPVQDLGFPSQGCGNHGAICGGQLCSCVTEKMRAKFVGAPWALSPHLGGPHCSACQAAGRQAPQPPPTHNFPFLPPTGHGNTQEEAMGLAICEPSCDSRGQGSGDSSLFRL